MRQGLPGFELDMQRSRLLREGQEIDLEPRTFDLLCYLVDHPDRLISKQELEREVWRAARVGDGLAQPYY